MYIYISKHVQKFLGVFFKLFERKHTQNFMSYLTIKGTDGINLCWVKPFTFRSHVKTFGVTEKLIILKRTSHIETSRI